MRLRRLLAPGLLAAAHFFKVVALAQTPVWTQFPNSPAGTLRHDDVIFTDLTNGWSARGIDGVYRTTNAGLSWIKVIANTNPVAHFRSIGFVSPMRGWAGNLGPGSYDGSVTDTNLLYETFDGGANWSVVTSINESGMKGFCAMHVKDAQHIYGVGRVRGPAFFAKTENGGASWSVTNLTAAGVMGGLMDVYFKDSQNGFIVGMDTNQFTVPPYFGSIARTTNGGQTWQVLVTTSVTNSYFWKMSWPSPNVGYASLQQNANYDTVVFYKTMDGGATWSSNGIPLTKIGSPSSFGLQGIGFVNENEGWMGGTTVLNPPYSFIHTTDGGLNWTSEGYANTRSINRIRFVNPTLGYMSGQTLHVYHVSLAVSVTPQNPTVAIGDTIVFSTAAYGTAPFGYQWRRNGTNLSGATSAAYSIPNVQIGHAGDYSVVVSDFSGSITSAVTTLSTAPLAVAPAVSQQPGNLYLSAGATATFGVTATGTSPLNYQWLWNGNIISGATNAVYARTNIQSGDAGNYSVRVTNKVGTVLSSNALLALSFVDDFDQYPAPITITNVGVTNGYRVYFNAASGGLDFKAVFGFNYAAVTFPTNIPTAPHSTGGSTKGLYLAVNKDDNGQVAAVNLYPLGLNFAGNFSLKFDVWLNWANLGFSTEHLMFGVDHSGNVTNRIGLATSDGLFFAMAADGNVAATTTTLRDFAVYRGAGVGNAPVFMTTNNTSFGPTPLLGPQFDNSNPGFTNLFPAKTIAGWGSSPAGSPGLSWVRVEVRQVNNRITWLLNERVVAQYANTYSYTNGNILLGYSDNFPSIGDTNSFAVIDNVRVENYQIPPVRLLHPQLTSSNFNFAFATELYESYTVQWATNLNSSIWLSATNLTGDGVTNTVSIPRLPGGAAQQYFRVRQP